MSKQTTLENAAKDFYNNYSEYLGHWLVGVGIGTEDIILYIHKEKIAPELPETWLGYKINTILTTPPKPARVYI